MKKTPLNFYDFSGLFFLGIVQCYMIVYIFASRFSNFRLLLDEKEALLLWLLFVFSAIISLILFIRIKGWSRFLPIPILAIELVVLLTAIIERPTW